MPNRLPDLIASVITSVVAIARADGSGWGGSGIVLSEGGLVLTVRHAVRRDQPSSVLTADGVVVYGSVVEVNADHDLALLKIPPGAYTVARLCADPKLRLGQSVLCIGAPYGYPWTCTAGIISGLDRTVTMPTGEVVEGCFQTDASINPGNSGGPLFNTDGEVVGMAFATRSEAENLAFAMTVEYVRKYLQGVPAPLQQQLPGPVQALLS